MMGSRLGFTCALLLITAAALSGDRITSTAHPGSFVPGASVRLCTEPGSPCTAETLVAGANADTTLVFSSTGTEMLPGSVVSLTAAGSQIPGPETNAHCGDSTDNDGDGAINEGCPSIGYDQESNRCDNAVNDDAPDDNVPPGLGINDGCLQAGLTPEAGVQCVNAANDDPADDSKVNDGCYPGGVGITQAETGGLCDDAQNEDPRDDAAGGGQKVNDGCPGVGSAEIACDDAIDNDGDTKVNDGCSIFGGVEPEVNECLNALDDDADGVVNDGCPEPALTSPPVGAVAGKVIADPAYFGLSNTPCNAYFPVTVGLYNSTTQNALWNEFGMGERPRVRRPGDPFGTTATEIICRRTLTDTLSS